MNNLDKTVRVFFVALLLLVCGAPAFAATTVTVDDDKVTVTQPNTRAQTVQTASVVPVVTRQAVTGDFEGRIADIDYAQSLIIVQDASGVGRAVPVKPETINSYRIGDYVVIHATADVALITVEENPRDFEGEIIRVDIPEGRIVVLDTNGRERKVQLKQGMIGTYKVGDYVQIRLMADLKEALTIKTLRDVRNIEGRIVSVDPSTNQIVVRDNDGEDSAVIVRQGLAHNYRTGDQVRIYLLPNRDQVQVIRVIR